jgi:signal transduction protein with GAF and PtsI domain
MPFGIIADDSSDVLQRSVQAIARLRTLERLNRLVSSSLAYEDVLAAIARAASDLMSAPVVSFWVVDEGAQTVTVRAFSDPALRDDFPLTSSRFGQGMAGRVAAERRPFHVPDVFAPDSPILARDWFIRHGLSSFYGVPVMFQDHVLAVLALNGRAPFALDEEDQELLASLVAQAAVSIRNAALFAQAESRRLAAQAAEARYRELFERSERLAATEREAETLRAVTRLANAAAHEINNPLTIIAGHLGTLEERFASDRDVAERLEKTWAACERIKEMVAHMRHITRLELHQPSPGLPPQLDLRRSSEEIL